MLDILKKLFELGFNNDFASEVTDVIKNGAIADQGFISQISTVIIPVAISLLVLFWMLELLDKSLKYQDGNLGWEHITLLIAKLILGKYLIQNSPQILEAVASIGETILSSLTQVTTGITKVNLDEIWKTIEEMPMISRYAVAFQLIPIGLMSVIASIAIRTQMYGRVIKLIILSAFSPLPISTLIFDGHRDMGKRFLQSFLATSLQGAVIIIIILLSKQLHSLTFMGILTPTGEGAVSEVSDLVMISIRALVINVILIFSLFKSEGWAKEIIGL